MILFAILSVFVVQVSTFDCPDSEVGYLDGGIVVCIDCGEGWTANDDQTDCLPLCPAGTFLGGNGCEECAVGAYSLGNTDYCTACPRDTSTLSLGTTSLEGCIDPSLIPEDYVMCKPGFQLVGTSSDESCRKCPKNSFSLGGRRTKCKRCPDDSKSPAGSGSVAECVAPTEALSCPAGFKSADAGCVQCRSGSYSEEGAGSCSPCPEGKISPVGATNVGQCYFAPCEAGSSMTRNGCLQCPAGSYSGPGADRCSLCPEGKISPAGSSKLRQCYYAPCDAGSSMTTEGCVQCPANSYSGPGADECSNCPGTKISAAGSTAIDQCYYESCDAGFTLTEEGCIQCPANSYVYNWAGLDVCDTCPDSKISAAGSMGEDKCYYAPCGTGSSMTKQGCVQCPIGTYSGAGADECSNCPEGQISATGSVDLVDCYFAPCGAGSRMTEQGCVQCPIGTYSGPGADECSNCPEGQISAAGSVDLTACYFAPCDAGSRMTEQGCVQCLIGTYSGAGADECSNCPEGQISAAGSVDLVDCYFAPCDAGSSMTRDGCVQCPENSYSGEASPECTSCPNGRLSPVGSTHANQCYFVPCVSGFYMSETGCMECSENFYSAAGADSCEHCPTGQISPAGSTGPSQCYFAPCDSGSFMNTNGCEVCAEDSYSTAGAEECTLCPAGKVSPSGSTNANDCYFAACEAGSRMTEEGCMLCPEGSYSEAAADECIACLEGMVSPAGSTEAGNCYFAPCDAGYSMSTEGCKVCPEDFFSESGAEECIPCSHGKISAAGSTSETLCTSPPAEEDPTCPPGSYLKSMDCEDCPRNTYSGEGATACSPCEEDAYSYPGSSSCSPLREAIIVAEYIGPSSASLSCVDSSTRESVINAVLVHANKMLVGHQTQVDLSCDDATWECFAFGYKPVVDEVPVKVYDGSSVLHETIVLNVAAGETATLDSGITDSSLLLRWVKNGRISGLVRISDQVKELLVSEAGRYAVQIRRCPRHSPVTQTTNVAAYDESTVTDHKVCSVFGDPHLVTFNGVPFTFHGACTYALAIDCAEFRWFIYGKLEECGKGVTCLAGLDVINIDPSSGQYYAIEVKRGFGINDNGIMRGVSAGETQTFGGIEVSFDGKDMRLELGEGVSIDWDGLAYAKITLPKEKEACGVCAQNDGERTTDFVTAWSVSSRDNCNSMVYDEEAVKDTITDNSFSTANDAFVNKAVFPFVAGANSVEHYLEAAAYDFQNHAVSTPFKTYRYMACSCYRARMEHARDFAGYVTERWDVDLDCPSPLQIIREGVRLGCPWTKDNGPFYVFKR